MKSFIFLLTVLLSSIIPSFGRQLDSLIIELNKKISDENYQLALKDVEYIVNSKDYLTCSDSTRNLIDECAYFVYAQNSDFQSSLKYAQKVEEYIENKFGKNDWKYAEVAIKKSTIYLLLNDEVAFRETIREVIKIYFWDFKFESNLKTFFYINERLNKYLSIGIDFLDEIRRIEEKIPYLQILTEVMKEEMGEQELFYTFKMMKYANTLSDFGLFDEAIGIHLKILNIIDNNISLGCKWVDYDKFTSFQNISAIYTDYKKFDSAKYYNSKLLEMISPQSWSVPGAQVKITQFILSREMGDYDKLDPIILKIDSIFYNEFKFDNLDSVPDNKRDYETIVYADFNFIKGNYFLQKNDIQNARICIKRSTNIFLKYKTYFEALLKIIKNDLLLGFLENEENNKELSEKYFSDALTQYYLLLKTVLINLVGVTKDNFISNMKDDFNIFYNNEIQKLQIDKNSISQILDNRIRTKGLLYYSDKNLKEELNTSENFEDFKKFKKYNAEISKIYLDFNLNPVQKKISIDSLDKIIKNIEVKIRRKLNRNNQDFFSLDINWHDIAKELQPDEAFVEIIKINGYGRYPNIYNPKVMKIQKNESDSKYLMIMIKKNTTEPEFIVFENAKELEEVVLKNYNYAINPDKNDIKKYSSNQLIDKVEKCLNKTYNSIWEEFDKNLKSIKKVYISKDGFFYNINFNLLIDNSGKYLLDKYELIDISSAKELLPVEKSKNNQNYAILFGAPDFNYDLNNKELISKSNIIDTIKTELTRASQGNLSDYSFLPNTMKEVDETSRILLRNKWHTKVYIGKDATEENLANIDSPRILHFATHGFFQKDTLNNILSVHPFLRNGLILAGANVSLKNMRDHKSINTTFDGILSAQDISKMELKNTDLVVLSACETGLGAVQNGEGIYGLQRAFQLAGVKQSIVSLWKVDDEVTRLLMVNFYKEYVKTNDASLSLIQAQKKLRKKYPFPKSWGSFILFGKD